MIGRASEAKTLNRLYNSGRAEFVAIYGRRRVGKTFLVDETFSGRITFRHAGLSPADEQAKGLLQAQLEQGTAIFAVTDHCDINGEVEKLYDFPFDPDGSWNAMMEVKEKYKGRLNVVCGIELGNATQYPEAARAVLDAHPYEFVIGSLHNLNRVPDFCVMNFGHMSDGLIRQLFDRSLDETLEMVQFPGITTLGHLTYMHRYVTLAGKKLDFKPYYVPSDFLHKAGKYDYEGGLIGDKANTVVFDNSKVKRAVPDFVCTVRADQGLRKTVRHMLATPALQKDDPEFDAWCDRVIDALERARAEV